MSLSRKLAISLTALFLIFILGVITFFKITAPEGCAVLQHYYFGDGKDLELTSDYFPKSPVIVEELKKMRIGEDKIIRLRQQRDWRLSYAINGFHLVKKKNGFSIYQRIEFDRTGDIYTVINLGLFKFKVKDNWVHVLPTTPFLVRYRFTG
jgi:hypothetical protein